MPRNVVVRTDTSGPVEWVARLAERAGDDRGLVLTAIDLQREKVSGGRIEEERDYAAVSFNTFDEPIFVGAAIAQLAGHAESVVVDGLEGWAARLLERFPDDPIELDAEVSSLVSVMQARMSDLLLVVRPDAVRSSAVRELLARMLARVEGVADTVVELRGASARATKGSLPT